MEDEELRNKLLRDFSSSYVTFTVTK